MNAKNIIVTVITFLTLFSMVWAGTEYFAKQKDFIDFKNEVSAWKLEDKALAIQKRIWFLEDRYGCPNCPNHITEYRQLLYDLNCINDKLKGKS